MSKRVVKPIGGYGDHNKRIQLEVFTIHGVR